MIAFRRLLRYLSHIRFLSLMTLSAKIGFAIFALVIVSVSDSAGAERSGFSIKSVAGWVRPVRPDEYVDLSTSGEQTGVDYLLVDNQFRVTGITTERYHHRAKRVLSTAALGDVSEIRFEFEPSYQKLLIHHIRILRGGMEIDALKPGEIKVIQQETNLDERIYNGTLSALVFLNDVRVADVIDYAYTVVGDNPALGGRFASQFYLGNIEPVERLRCRLLWPVARKLNTLKQRTELEPTVTRQGQEIEYTWETTKVKALEYEDAVPDWFKVSPSVELSEFESWEDVARWNASLFQSKSSLPAELAK